MISIIITAVFYAFFASVILFGLYLLAVKLTEGDKDEYRE